jgi:YD repeat-containing protein
MDFLHKPFSVTGTTRLFCLALLLILACPESSRCQSGTVYIYDELGRLVGVVDPSSGAARYVYDATGNIVSISRYSSAKVSIIVFTPNAGPFSTPVRIHGTGFSTTATLNNVKFSGVKATVLSSSSTEIVTSVPVGATTGAITVTTPAGSTSSSQPFTVVSSKTPTINGFTPAIASPGSVATINGTNFQLTPSNNAVRFNLTLSQVAAATPMKITASVPVGATSGRLSVATPYGKTTSTADFFVPPAPYKPSDVGFTGRMSLGETRLLTIGASRKIGLMLFDGQSDHRVSLVASGSTFGSCGLTLSILSPNGVNLASSIICGAAGFLDTSTLTDDGTYTILAQTSVGADAVTLTLGDVPPDFTSGITPGGPPVTVKITAPGQNARLTFSGSSGERVSLNLSNGTFPTCGSRNVSIVRPDGTALTPAQCVGTGGFIGAQTLPMSGTYTILVAPADASTGSIVLTLYKVLPDVTGTITPGGPAVSVHLTSPGQNAELTFGGTLGEQVSLNLTNGTYHLCSLNVSILKPGGTALTPTQCVSTNGFIDTQTLPISGTYKILLTPTDASTGSVTLTLYNVVDVKGTITIGGPAINVNIRTLGQNAELTFVGTANQQVTVHAKDSTIKCLTIGIVNLNGTSLFSEFQCLSTFDLPVQTLPAKGTYTLSINPFDVDTGSMTVNMTSP